MTLDTKVILPPLRSRHVARNRLLDKIAARPEATLVLVSAPGGFGKTTCLQEWCYASESKGCRVAWYSLDAQDNDPARFKSNLVAAFHQADESLAIPESTYGNEDWADDLESAVTSLLNAVGDSKEQYVLVLDDYHLVHSPAIHDVLSIALDHLPGNIKLGIGTRADPPLQLARRRALGSVVELRAADLRFSANEAGRLFEKALSMTPSAKLVDRLEKVSEGWATALLLIALSLNDQEDLDDNVVLEHLERFSSAHRHIFDYFAEEIFGRQTESIKKFLLDTCVLSRLSPDVCRELTGSDDALQLLDELAEKSLFVIPLSEVEPVFRYHHLFEAYLRQRLQREDQKRFYQQHLVAARWHVANGHITDAVDHALESRDYSYAASLFEASAWETLTARGEIVTVLGWLDRFPNDALQQNPRACLYFSRALYVTGDLGQSDEYLKLAAAELDRNPESHTDHRDLQAIALNYQATLGGYEGNISEAIGLNERAALIGQELSALDRVRMTNTGAHLCYLKGDLAAARAAYAAALEEARRIDHRYLMLDALYYLAWLDLMEGRLQQAKRRCEAALAEIESQIAPLCTMMLPLACIHYEENRTTEAETLMRDAVKFAVRGKITDVLWLAYCRLSAILAARGELDEASMCVRQARQVTRTFHSPAISSFIAATEVRIALCTKPSGTVSDWLANYDPGVEVEYRRTYEDLTLARVRLAHGDPESALSLLDPLADAAQTAGRMGDLLETRALQAIAFHMRGQRDKSLELLGLVLPHAEREGYVRLLLDMGSPMRALLETAVGKGAETDYAEHLLCIARGSDGARHPADALTAREIEVLRQIAGGATNQEIAGVLFISIGTVKSHIHRIMGKLNAQNRTEAVAKARGIGILGS